MKTQKHPPLTRLKTLKQTCFARVFVLLYFCVFVKYLPIATNFVFAQALEGPDVRLQIRELDLETSDKPLNAPQPPQEFTKQGYMVQTLPPDSTVSKAFTSDPGAYLVRAKPGVSVDIPLTVHNFKNAAVLQLEITAFIEPTVDKRLSLKGPKGSAFYSPVSIDCARVKIASCAALDWVKLTEESESHFFIESGQKKQINLTLAVPETAPEGDYYLSFQISAYNKPYQYTSSLFYLTIINSGITPQNISLEALSAKSSQIISRISQIPLVPLIISPNIALQITAQNGSPYFALLQENLTVKSPLGFKKTIPLPKTVLLANQTKIINISAENFPLGPSKIIYGGENKKSRWIFVLPRL